MDSILDSVVGETEASNGERGRSGLGAYLAATRMLLGNRFSRALLSRLVRKTRCVINGEGYEVPAIQCALASLAGEVVSAPLGTRIVSGIINLMVRLGVALLHGDMETVREALRDPAVRRGVALVLEGIARYGVTVPQKLPAPFLVVWNFTNMCNLRCKHCYQRADRPLPSELTLEEKLKLVDDLDKAGVAAVALSGGEPTIHPHFERVLSELARRGIYAAVATNGWVFADIKRLERAKRLGLRYVEVSVDSVDPEKHDKFRGVKGSWERAVKALMNAVKLGLNHAMAVTLTRENIDEIEDFFDLAEEIGVKKIVFFNFVPVGRGEENAWLDLSPEEREEALRKIYRESRRRGIEAYSTAPQYSRIVLQESGGREAAPTHFYIRDPIVTAVAEYVGGCGAGRIYAAIEPDGRVTPCVFMPVAVGSVRVKSFREIWEEAPLFQMLRDRDKLKGFCGKCPYRYICGGCRARALAYTGDPLGPDPGCIYNKRVWDEIVARAKARQAIAAR